MKMNIEIKLGREQSKIVKHYLELGYIIATYYKGYVVSLISKNNKKSVEVFYNGKYTVSVTK